MKTKSEAKGRGQVNGNERWMLGMVSATKMTLMGQMVHCLVGVEHCRGKEEGGERNGKARRDVVKESCWRKVLHRESKLSRSVSTLR